MTDPLEAALREEFEAVAAGAPAARADRAGVWAGTARARVRARRRRAALIAGAAVAVLAVAVPFGVLGRDRQDRAAVPATPEPSPSPDEPLDPAADGVLHVRGVTVRVPRSMLEPGNRRCGTSLVDAAWWEDRHTGTRSCLVEAPTSALTEVTLRVVDTGERVETGQRRTVLQDGRTEISVGFPDRRVVLWVTSPQPQRAQRIVASARQVPEDGEVLGCEVRDPGRFEASGQRASRVRSGASGRRAGRIEPEQVDGGVVCGYRDGWLVGAYLLDRVAGVRLAEQIAMAPPMIPRDRLDCPSYAVRTGAWMIRLSAGDGPQTRFRVEPAACPEPGVVSDRGIEAAVSSELVQTLTEHAEGPVHEWGGDKPESSQAP